MDGDGDGDSDEVVILVPESGQQCTDVCLVCIYYKYPL